jgi:hypothetical protein
MDEETQDKMLTLRNVVLHTVEVASKLSNRSVRIISNGTIGWIEKSATLFGDTFLQELKHRFGVEYRSAQDEYPEPNYAKKRREVDHWKPRPFGDEMKRCFEDGISHVANVLSFGDLDRDLKAHDAAVEEVFKDKCFKNKVLKKQVKLPEYDEKPYWLHESTGLEILISVHNKLAYDLLVALWEKKCDERVDLEVKLGPKWRMYGSRWRKEVGIV